MIVDIHFGNAAYTFRDIYTGLQNFNESYFYFATTLNRFWNESEISNSVITDLVPSFAPTVITTIPAENGTINITDNIIIEFSKTMDITSFTNAISITPSVGITSLNWSADNKTLTISTEAYLYEHLYTLVIDSTVTDINGKYIDGNGDGEAGDPFVLNFQTSEEDIIGPKITYSYPSDNDSDVDIASIITIVFDEEVDAQSLTNNPIVLTDGVSQINFNYQHSKTSDGRSIICVQPTLLLHRNKDYTLTLDANIADTLGNILGEDTSFTFTTSDFSYSEIKMIDNFTVPGDWKQPGYSGSTAGIIESGTHFEFTNQIYLPATNPKKSAKLSYLWNENASSFLIREYLGGGVPQETYFDTSYVLQSYVYGDGSNNLFRFCIDEFQGTGWGDHEVSNWVALDWYGWKLIEWQLNDPNSVGIWIGDETLTGTYFRIDSYQLTKTSEGLISGIVYFDDLRAVKKILGATFIDEQDDILPAQFVLNQNYPNPFNPSPRSDIQFPLYRT